MDGQTDKHTLVIVVSILQLKIVQDGLISREQFVLGMSVFLFGTEKEQTRYCFSVYDLTGKGIIGKEEMTTLLQKCLKLQGQEEEGEDGVKVDCVNTIFNQHYLKL